MTVATELKFRCPACTRKLTIERRYAGAEVACPECNFELEVPNSRFGTGDEIDGFRIEMLLGMGSAGEVYLAEELSMARPVALKVLRADLPEIEEETVDFIMEARTLGNVNHEHVVTAFRTGSVDKVHYLAMRYVEGPTLLQRLLLRGPMDVDQTIQMALVVADALDYAWEKMDLLHRDVKPGNIMFDTDENVLLLDLGISQCMRKGQNVGRIDVILGSPAYMSPEQIQAKPVLDCRVDIYGLGATMYHALTGEPPFSGDGQEIMKRKLIESAPSPLRIRRDLPSKLVRLISRCLSINPADRPPDWLSFIAELKAAAPR